MGKTRNFGMVWLGLKGFFRMPRWLEWLGSRSLFGMAATMVIVVAGVCASLFTESIRTIGASWIPAPDDAAGGWLFWLMVFLAALLFWVNHAALTHKSEKARMDLETAVKRLNTIPSEIFLPTYTRCWKQAASITLACIAAKSRNGLKRDDVEEAIKAVQLAILESAKDFDNADGASDYSANIMLWRDQSKELERNDALSIVQVAPGDPMIAGVLELIPTLSVVVKGGEKNSKPPESADTLTRPILLPIPEGHANFLDDAGVEKLVLLPGAPFAFATGRCTVFPSMQEFIEILRNGTTLDERVKRRVTQYFTEGEGKHVRSFASFAILSGHALPLGVLNLHSNRPGLLEDNGETLFAPVLSPFLTLLSVLLSLRAETPVESAVSAG